MPIYLPCTSCMGNYIRSDWVCIGKKDICRKIDFFGLKTISEKGSVKDEIIYEFRYIRLFTESVQET